MSKKRKAKRGDPADLVHVRTMREARWAADRRRDRLTWGQIADLSGLPPERGGLGYVRSPKQLRALYDEHRAEVLTLEESTRPEALLLELETINAAHREYASMAGVIDQPATELARDRARAEGMSDEDVERIVVLRDAADRARALDGILKASDRRSKLLGLDAPLAVEVTHRDGDLDQLNDALAALGEQPLIPTAKD